MGGKRNESTRLGESAVKTHEIIERRLKAVQDSLMAWFDGGSASSSATKGREREAFVHSFFEQILPIPYRVGSGDITDQTGQRSGQVDVVVEYAHLPSFPSPGGERLYLAEGVAAVLEIKSDVAAKWKEIRMAAEKIKKLWVHSYMGRPPVQVPVFAVGYDGWKKLRDIQRKLSQSVASDGTTLVDGILVIRHGLFATTEAATDRPLQTTPEQYPNKKGAGFYQVRQADGPWALWGLICSLAQLTSRSGNSGYGSALDLIQYMPSRFRRDLRHSAAGFPSAV